MDNKTPETFEALKKMVSETVFTHNPPQVYGEDPYWDPESWEATVRTTHGLTGQETSELFQVAKFRAVLGPISPEEAAADREHGQHATDELRESAGRAEIPDNPAPWLRGTEVAAAPAGYGEDTSE